MKIAFVFLALLASAVIAAPSEPCKSDDPASIQQCITADLAAKDKQLNTAYQKVLQGLTPQIKDNPIDYAAVKRLLVEGQRAWIRFRDNDCNALAPLIASGTSRMVAVVECKIQRTEQRTKELKSWGEV